MFHVDLSACPDPFVYPTVLKRGFKVYMQNHAIRPAFRWTAILALVSATGMAAAAVLPHWQIQGYRHSLGPVHASFQPYLHVSSGCTPFPAVDAAGNVSGGLDNSGAENGGCSSSPGQVYVRQGHYGGRCAIMYAWYFPKDQNVPGPVNGGHRHDWENIVVWVDECYANAQIRHLAFSSHGGYVKYDYNGVGNFKLYGSHPKVNYGQHGGIFDHDVSPTDDLGGQQPGVSWDNMTAASHNALNTYNFGKAVVPFKDSEFVKNLAKAY